MKRRIRTITRFTAILVFLAAVTLVPFGTVNALAKDPPVLLGEHGIWRAYQYERDGVRTCYILGQPSIARPTNLDHGHVFFMASMAAGQKTMQPQFVVGYPMKEDFPARLSIDSKVFSLFIQDNKAWMASPSDEPHVITAMQNGGVLTIHTQSQKGTSVHYDFPLNGTSAAFASLRPCLPAGFSIPKELKPL